MRQNYTWMLAAMILSAPMGWAGDDLERGFHNPPDSAKPYTSSWWMNGNVTKEGITADFEAMKRVGLGGLLLLQTSWQTPPGPATFMGKKWREMIGHAVVEAGRLGLEIGMHNCAGWSSSGGPWITPEQAQQRLVTSEQTVQGPVHFSAVLPQPPVRANYYRDVAVLAFCTPQGETESRMKASAPKITASFPGFDAAKVLDGDPKTFAALPLPPAPQKPYLQIEFAEPFAARTLALMGPPIWHPLEVQVSEDGQTFKTIRHALGHGRENGLFLCLSTDATPVRARYYRVVFPRQENIQVTELVLSDRLSVENFDSKAALLREGGGIYSSPENGRVRADSVAGSAGQATPGLAVPREAVQDLTSRLTPDGKLDWEVPEGRWTILRLGHTADGNSNKGSYGVGLECDKFSKAALEAHWAGMMRQVVEAAGPLAGKALVSAYVDSWEVGCPNWTAAFPEEFRRRRGYDLRPFLPVLSNRIVDSPEISERFLWDYRRTIADLFAENYYGHLATLAHRNGLKFQAQTYGCGPMDELLSSATADIPMGEFWQTTYSGAGEPSCKIAASAAHAYGRPIIAAESYSGGGKWDLHPFALKPYGDVAYCRGINRFDMYCGEALQPWMNVAPGMTMGNWGLNFDRNVTWWEQGRAWISYLTRCQYLLQEGRFVADVCFFDGEDYLAGHQMGSDYLVLPAKSPMPKGYDYDLLDRKMLLGSMNVENGLFVLPSGMRYRFLVLPDSKALTLPVVKKVRELVAAGGTVLGPKPQFSPTLENYPADEVEIRKIADEVWGPCDGKTVTENRFGKGRIVWGKSYAEVFAETKLAPDFAFSGNAMLNTIHRASKDADWYFVASCEKSSVETVCAFRVTGKRPEFWHPDTGEIEPAAWYRIENGQTFVPMRLDPCGSVFVVFRSPAEDGIISVARDGKPIAYEQKREGLPAFKVSGKAGEVMLTAFAPGRYEFATAAGKKANAAIKLSDPLALEGGWNVQFDPKWAGPPAPVRFEQLEDWTKRPEEGIKYFSGTAVYEKEFEIPASYKGAGHRLWLDLGRVEVIAEVEVNGKNLGILWKPPFAADMTDAIKPGKNTVKVRVTNLWPNRLIGDEHLPADCEYTAEGALKAFPEWLTKKTARTSGRVTFATWRHWKAEDPLLPSGLLGPVRLVPASFENLNFKKAN